MLFPISCSLFIVIRPSALLKKVVKVITTTFLWLSWYTHLPEPWVAKALLAHAKKTHWQTTDVVLPRQTQRHSQITHLQTKHTVQTTKVPKHNKCWNDIIRMQQNISFLCWVSSLQLFSDFWGIAQEKEAFQEVWCVPAPTKALHSLPLSLAPNLVVWVTRT